MSFMKKLFSSSKKGSVGGDAPTKEELAVAEKEERRKKKIQRGHTVDTGALDKRTADDMLSDKPKERRTKPREEKSGHRSHGAAAQPKAKEGKQIRSKKKKDKKQPTNVHVDVDQPISDQFPCTPEIILEYHRQKPFLSQNEEWLIVELNEFECLVDSMDIIKIIAKRSKFFEVDPDELWEEFFEYVEEMPSYDEVINYDVWQEFRDEKYPC